MGRTRRRPHVTQSGARRGGSSGPWLRLLVPTLGILVVFLIVAAPAIPGLRPGSATPEPGDEATNTAGPTPTPAPGAPQGDLGPPSVALVAGHTGSNPYGPPDPGTVCADGLTEASITQAVADRVAELIRARGYPVTVLGEFDERLPGLRASAFVSIHVDSCEYVNDEATGFKVSGPENPRAVPELHQRLAECLSSRYLAATGLRFHGYSISPDMYDYHAFGEIDARTPAAIIELGFLYLDRRILTEEQARVAQGVADGILCSLQPQ